MVTYSLGLLAVLSSRFDVRKEESVPGGEAGLGVLWEDDEPDEEEDEDVEEDELGDEATDGKWTNIS